MHVPRTLLAALLSGIIPALAVSPATISVPVSATVLDSCEISSSPLITIPEYEAADAVPEAGYANLLVRCNQDTIPFVAFWDDTGFNSDGSFDLLNGANKFNVTLGISLDPEARNSEALGSNWTYRLSAAPRTAQWSVPNGIYTANADVYVGW